MPQKIIVRPINMYRWPTQDYDSMVAYYGAIGENQTSLVLPYPMILGWDKARQIKKITCHSKVAKSLYNIFTKTLELYGQAKITELKLDVFGGCLNVRKMRGSKETWSIHSWGAAVDLAPDENQLRWGKDKALFAKPDYNDFWDIVIKEERWVSLGKASNRDFMHFQAANL